MNLDTLLIQTDFTIIMWDNSYPKTFENIPHLISTIEDCLRQSEIKVPIFVLQNKMDLKFDLNEISVEIDKFDDYIKKLKENANITYKEITLKDNQKKDFYELIRDIDDKLSENSPKKMNDIYKVKYYYPLKENKSIGENINCLLLGNQGSGKTSFLKSLVGESISNLISTIGIDKAYFNYSFEGKEHSFVIFDTAGQERYNSLTKSYFRHANAFLLFFDVTNEESFEKVQKWIGDIVDNKGNINEEYELFLVANKIDEIEMRKIGKAQGKNLANKYNIKYFEISCLKKINIYELLYEITLMSYKKSEPIKRNKSIRLKKNKKDNNKKKRVYVANWKISLLILCTYI